MHVWRERLNRWLTPLASGLPVSPGTVTTAALVGNLSAAALLYGAGANPSLFLVAAFLIAFSGLLDAVDGALARARGVTSRFGDFLDHLFDRISDVAVLVGWCFGAAVRPLLTVVTVVVVMLNGYIGTQVEASFGRRTYTGAGRGEFVLAFLTFPLIQFTLVKSDLATREIGGMLISEWLTAAIAIFAFVGFLERFAEARKIDKSGS